MESRKITAESSQGIEPNADKGLGNQVYDALVTLILSRELKQGEEIRERALALRLSVSRTPLREAMHRLEGERVLERNSNNRLYVRLVSTQEIMEILYVRRMLESDAAARSVGRIPADKLTDIRRRIEELMRLNDAWHPAHRELDTELHGLIGEHCENELLANMIADLRRKTRLFSLKHLENRATAVCTEHMAIVDALARGDAETVAAETVRHIDNIRQAIIDKLSRY